MTPAVGGVEPMRDAARWLAILLAGPPIGALLLLLALGAGPATPQLAVAVLPPAYLLGLAPAIAVAALDHSLARRGQRLPRRLMAGAAAGASVAALLLVPLYLAGLVKGPVPLILPLAAATTAVVCLLTAALAGRLAGPVRLTGGSP